MTHVIYKQQIQIRQYESRNMVTPKFTDHDDVTSDCGEQRIVKSR